MECPLLIILAGLPGVGKTTLARSLARKKRISLSAGRLHRNLILPYKSQSRQRRGRV